MAVSTEFSSKVCCTVVGDFCDTVINHQRTTNMTVQQNFEENSAETAINSSANEKSFQRKKRKAAFRVIDILH